MDHRNDRQRLVAASLVQNAVSGGVFEAFEKNMLRRAKSEESGRCDLHHRGMAADETIGSFRRDAGKACLDVSAINQAPGEARRVGQIVHNGVNSQIKAPREIFNELQAREGGGRTACVKQTGGERVVCVTTAAMRYANPFHHHCPCASVRQFSQS